jgi:hypothetical protein
MRDACKRANRRVGENGTCHVDNGTTYHTDTVKGVDMATGSDAFGITSLYIRKIFWSPTVTPCERVVCCVLCVGCSAEVVVQERQSFSHMANGHSAGVDRP